MTAVELRDELLTMEKRLDELSNMPIDKMPEWRAGQGALASDNTVDIVQSEWIARTYDRLYSACQSVRWARIATEVTYSLPDVPAKENEVGIK